MEESVGTILVRDLARIDPGKFKSVTFKKAYVVTREDIPILKRIGKEPFYILEIKKIDMLHAKKITRIITILLFTSTWHLSVGAQEPPSSKEIAGYTGILAAAARGDAKQIGALIKKGENPNVRDGNGRTPLHAAAFKGHHEAMRVLVAAGLNPNALENDRYDIVTIAAVANDVPTIKIALSLGASANNITSRYDGTALIAATHLGHVEVVRMLIHAGAPLDHINNLGWTAVIESIVVGDGGQRHTETLRALVEAGANVNLTDRNGQTPLSLARSRGYKEMVSILQSAQ